MVLNFGIIITSIGYNNHLTTSIPIQSLRFSLSSAGGGERAGGGGGLGRVSFFKAEGESLVVML